MKKDRAREMSMEIVVGAFMFIVLLGLGILTIVLSRENLFTPSYPMNVVFDEVQGLREGDEVVTRGVSVGRVKEMQIRDDGVHLLLRLDHPVQLHEDYRVEIIASSVLGGHDLSIYAGSKESPLLPKDAEIKGSPPMDLVKEASYTVHSLREVLVDGGVLDNLKSTMEQVNKITARLEQGEGTIGKLLRDPAVYDDLSEVVANLKDVSTRLNEGKGSLGKLLSEDDTVYNDLAEITTNLKVVSERLADGKGTLGKLLSEDDTLYNDLSEGAAAIKSVAQGVNSGDGTLGKLTKDDKLYQEALLLVQEIRATVDDIRETSPLTTFTSVFFGAF